MPSLGVFSFLAAVLQLTIPSYAFRLVRRYGAERVGWFIVAAFASLAMLYVLQPLKGVPSGPLAGLSADGLFIFASALLLVGMAHLEAFYSQRRAVEEQAQANRRDRQDAAQEQTTALARTNEQLTQEIARREQKEKTLRESEAQYRFLFLENPRPMWIFDLRSHRFLAVNQAALRLYGFTREEFLALSVRDLLPASSVAAFLQAAARPCPADGASVPGQHFRKDLTPLEVELTAADLKFGEVPARLVLVQDVTQSRRRDRQVRQVEKLEALGQLAGGVAEHLTQLFCEVEAKALLWRQGQAQGSDLSLTLQELTTAVNRVGAFTRQLLAIGARQSHQPGALDLNVFLRTLQPTLRRLICGQVNLSFSYGSALPPVLADPHLLEQILINLVLNAREAMPQGGLLHLATSRMRLDPHQAQPPTKAGDFLRVVVRDTGVGMSPEVQARIFEPFFTTAPGQAAGLGLASVYGLTKQLGGWVEFTSTPGAGTEFRLFLPVAAPNLVSSAQRTLGATILLVEPDEKARGLARHILSSAGYQVIEADSGATALALWQGQASKVHLLLAAAQLPEGLTGQALAEQLRQDQPDLKVALVQEPTEGRASEPSLPGRGGVAKPYTSAGLLQAVQQCLGLNA